LPDSKFEILGIEQSSGAFTDHVDGDVAGFHASRGQSKSGIGTDAVSVGLKSVGKPM